MQYNEKHINHGYYTLNNNRGMAVHLFVKRMSFINALNKYRCTVIITFTMEYHLQLFINSMYLNDL